VAIKQLICDVVHPEPAAEGPVEAATTTCVLEALAARVQPCPTTCHRTVPVHDDAVTAGHETDEVRS